MSEKFSATLKIGDLNDYIAPSQSVGKARSAPKAVQTEPVTISLKDCLACSGCITSAETVMLERQSSDEFLSNLNKGKAVIVSLSPQSRASLAVRFGLSPYQMFGKLTTLFKSFGVKARFDASCSRDLTLIESCTEFIARYNKCSPTDEEKPKSPLLPMISSACPGWICYAEKTLGSYILPYISLVKSPQQTIGAAIKNHMFQKLGLRPEEIYHVTIMPCYDKKLEAARDDFVFQLDSDGERITEVDSVLTTGEVLDLIKVSFWWWQSDYTLFFYLLLIVVKGERCNQAIKQQAQDELRVSISKTTRKRLISHFLDEEKKETDVDQESDEDQEKYKFESSKDSDDSMEEVNLIWMIEEF